MSSLYGSAYPTKDTIDYEQSTHVSCYVGATGSGKTIQMTNKLIDISLSAPASQLPIITFIHTNTLPVKFINVITQALPIKQKHLAIKRKLRNRKDCAVNPFDIKVGLIRPLPRESDQIKTFLTTLLTPSERVTSYAGVDMLAGVLVEKAFEIGCDDKAHGIPKMYTYGNSDIIDTAINEYGIVAHQELPTQIDDNELSATAHPARFTAITSHELTRKLHIAGERYRIGSGRREHLWRARDLAHRTAMPVLADLIGILNEMDVTAEYNNIIDTGESLIEFAKRTIHEAIETYPCFSNLTQFDVDSARIVTLCLQGVIKPTDRRHNSLFFQVARMIAIRKVDLTNCDVLCGIIPELYHDYYKDTLRAIADIRKFLVVDDMRYIGQELAISKLIESDCRESRKLALEIMMASQLLTDFYGNDGSDDIRLLFYVTSLYVLSNPKPNDLELLKRFFTNDPVILEGLLDTGVSKKGLNYFSYIITKKRTYQQFSTVPLLGNRFASLTN